MDHLAERFPLRHFRCRAARFDWAMKVASRINAAICNACSIANYCERKIRPISLSSSIMLLLATALIPSAETVALPVAPSYAPASTHAFSNYCSWGAWRKVVGDAVAASIASASPYAPQLETEALTIASAPWFAARPVAHESRQAPPSG